MLEFVFALTLIATHLSTWAEEWILWTTAEFNFIKLPQTVLHRLVDHAAEDQPGRAANLIRGKTARVIGNLQTLLVLVKGLPLAYNRDLQEDKAPAVRLGRHGRSVLGAGRAAGGGGRR